MCGIFGLAFTTSTRHEYIDDEDVIEMLAHMFKETQVYGRDASGLAIVGDGEINVLKAPKRGGDFIQLDSYKDFVKKYVKIKHPSDPHFKGVKVIIGHCRAMTQGDYRKNINNHPIVTENVVGVHNGVISNDHTLFNDMKNYRRMDRNGEVDSEIIFKLIDHFQPASKDEVVQPENIDDLAISGDRCGLTLDSYDMTKSIQSACQLLDGSYMIAFVHRIYSHVLWLVRHGNMCHLNYHKRLGIYSFGTGKQITDFTKVKELKQVKVVADCDTKEIEYDSMVGINTLSNKVHYAKLKPKLNGYSILTP